MKTLSALAAAATLIALPATAATQTTPPPTKAEPTPYTIKADTPCPTIPKDTLLSKTTQRLFETISDACLLKASGAITDAQFEQIRDQAVNGITYQLQAEIDQQMSQPLAMNH